jgi:hypothetical protein
MARPAKLRPSINRQSVNRILPAEEAETQGTLTFLLSSRCEVGCSFYEVRDIATSDPKPNPFTPSIIFGRPILKAELEFQCFEHQDNAISESR